MKGNFPTIMITGFYGAGNSGDEAMLRNFCFKIKERIPNAIILVATDRYGTWRIDDVHYISALDRAKLIETDLLVIGGGDLGIGFGWNLLVFAKKSKCKCVMMGTSISDTWIDSHYKDLVYHNLKLFDKIFVRDEQSCNNLRKVGIDNGVATTDIAIDLPRTESIPFVREDNVAHVSLCIREVRDIHKERMTLFAHDVIKRLVAEGHTISILPFCSEDVLICNEVAKVWSNKVQIIYSYDCQQHKHVITNSDYLISLGRFHPLVYAVHRTIPHLVVSYPEAYGYSKTKAWMEHVGMSEYFVDFSAPIKEFEEKWALLKKNTNSVMGHLSAIRKRHFALNNQQFDEAVGLIL